MADLPSLTPDQVAGLVSGASDVQLRGQGGQKLVFRGILEGNAYALKFAKVPELPEEEETDTEDVAMSDVVARARREVETMLGCDSIHMVKLGPVGLSLATIEGQNLLFFSEEFIDGHDLREVLRSEGRQPPAEIGRLGLHVSDAIRSLWRLGKIHRDIKPANVMRRSANREFVLLDAGLVFDVTGESLSIGPVGTPRYFSPEQFDFTNRRTKLDFRSDQFSLGVTMYELATGQHPFWSPGDTSQALFTKITTHTPNPPSDLVPGFPPQLEEAILRLLGKSPHLRYRTTAQLVAAFEQIQL